MRLSTNSGCQQIGQRSKHYLSQQKIFWMHFARSYKFSEDNFIAKQQSAYCTEREESLGKGEVLVIEDFAENYSFILQDAAQGFHWNTAQATLHPFVCYYRINEELKHTSFVVISDCLTHDTVAVHLFQKCLVFFLCSFLLDHHQEQLRQIIYFSDGAASQYKNYKNFINLCHHKSDFGVDAEWHFIEN